MADPIYPDETGVHYQWSTNAYPVSNPNNGPSYGVYNQYYVSGHPTSAPASGGQWADPVISLPPSMQGVASSQVTSAEAAFFNAFFTPIASGGFEFEGQVYNNTQLQIQAPYTPTRIIFSPFLLQANDPLVHYLASDLNSQSGTSGVWENASIWPNGSWTHVDNLVGSSSPMAPTTPVGGRYQPWGVKPTTPVTGGDTTGYSLAYKDPLVWMPDNWNFPTNLLSDLTGLGQVHRGTPWQTVYLKSTNVLQATYMAGIQGPQNVGTNEWAVWTGDINVSDAALMAPVNDWRLAALLMSLLNTKNPAQLLSVNDPNVVDWQNILNGMTVFSNSAASVYPGTIPQYDIYVMSSNSAPALAIASAIVQARSGQAGQNFYSIGDILSVPGLDINSPWLDTTNNAYQAYWGITDTAYEAIPAQLLPLLRPDSIGTLATANGGWNVQFSGADGYCYGVQTSTNLINWITVGTNQPVQGTFSVPVGPGSPQQFYRTVLLP
jgi:hypothetical protein